MGFADGFSHLYERATLVEQLKCQRDRVCELFFGAIDRNDELREADIDAERRAPSGLSPVGLTEREVDVFNLMVTGASNHDIADQLVITEGTVKSDVKHILRKYGALSAQAIAWALNG